MFLFKLLTATAVFGTLPAERFSYFSSHPADFLRASLVETVSSRVNAIVEPIYAIDRSRAWSFKDLNRLQRTVTALEEMALEKAFKDSLSFKKHLTEINRIMVDLIIKTHKRAVSQANSDLSLQDFGKLTNLSVRMGYAKGDISFVRKSSLPYGLLQEFEEFYGAVLEGRSRVAEERRTRGLAN